MSLRPPNELPALGHADGSGSDFACAGHDSFAASKASCARGCGIAFAFAGGSGGTLFCVGTGGGVGAAPAVAWSSLRRALRFASRRL